MKPPNLKMILCGLSLSAILLTHTYLARLSSDIGIHIIIYLLAFAPYFLSIKWRPKLQDEWIMICLFACLFRLIVVGASPVFSDDIYRYLWEGKMMQNHINPYLTAPSDLSLQHLHDQYFSLINHKSIPSIYPPLSQIAFMLITSVKYNLYFMKFIWALFDLLLIGVLLLILKKENRPRSLIIFYAWNPLSIIETSGSGHQDILGILLLWLAIYVYLKRKIIIPMFFIILSALSKLYPLVILPFLLRTAPKTIVRCFGVITLGAFFFFLPSLLQYHGLLAYLEHWEFNGSLYPTLLSITSSPRMSKMILVIGFMIYYRHVYLKEKPLIESSALLLGAFLLCLPTLYPWYLLWILPFLCFIPNPAWLVLSCLIVMTYQTIIHTQSDGVWLVENMYLQRVEYGIFYLILLGGGLRRKRSKPDQSVRRKP